MNQTTMTSKLTELQNELKAPKNLYNKFGKYSYRDCSSIMEAVKPLLLKHGLTLTITDEVKDCALGAYVEASAVLTDNGKLISASDAQAGIEKAGGMALPQAFGSASSYARKYALNGLFLIDDTKDADATNDHQPAAKKPLMTAKDAETKLEAAKTVEDLVKVWNSLPIDLKQVDTVTAAKDKKKAGLTK
jgi:hypothetical protein